jgi:hypothetical protein
MIAEFMGFFGIFAFFFMQLYGGDLRNVLRIIVMALLSVISDAESDMQGDGLER